MQSFKFNAGLCSVERAIADAIGQGIAARREADASLPQRFAQLIARLDEIHDAHHAHNAAPLQSRKPPDR